MNNNKGNVTSINPVYNLRRNRIPTDIMHGGITNQTLETIGLRLDAQSGIAIAFDGQGENPTLSIGGNALGLGNLGQYTFDHIIPDTLKDHMADEFMTKGIGYSEFYIKQIIITFRASKQSIINLSGPLYYKIDNMSHSINDLTSIKPTYINQNQTKRVVYKYPKLDSQVNIGQQTRNVWVPVGIDELWGELNKTYISVYSYASAMNPFYASFAPLWNLQISVDVVFKKRQIENLENMLARLQEQVRIKNSRELNDQEQGIPVLYHTDPQFFKKLAELRKDN